MSAFNKLVLDLREFDLIVIDREVLDEIRKFNYPKMGTFEQMAEIGQAIIQYRELLLLIRSVKIAEVRGRQSIFELGIISGKEIVRLFSIVATNTGYEAVPIYGDRSKTCCYTFTCPECDAYHEVEVEVEIDDILLVLAKASTLLQSGKLSLVRLSTFGRYDDSGKSFQTFTYKVTI